MQTNKILIQYSRSAVQLRTSKSPIKVYSNALTLFLDIQTALQLFYKFSDLRGT